MYAIVRIPPRHDSSAGSVGEPVASEPIIALCRGPKPLVLCQREQPLTSLLLNLPIHLKKATFSTKIMWLRQTPRSRVIINDRVTLHKSTFHGVFGYTSDRIPIPKNRRQSSDFYVETNQQKEGNTWKPSNQPRTQMARAPPPNAVGKAMQRNRNVAGPAGQEQPHLKLGGTKT